MAYRVAAIDKSQSRWTARMIKEIKMLGYRVEGGAVPVGAQA